MAKSDGEPAMLSVRDAMMKYHGGKVVPERPPKGDKAEHALAEGVGKTIREYVCTFISQIEEGIGDGLPKDSPIHMWAVRWAAIC